MGPFPSLAHLSPMTTVRCGTQEMERGARLRMALDVVNGMHYLERRGFVHRDLATRNVLLTADHICKASQKDILPAFTTSCFWVLEIS